MRQFTALFLLFALVTATCGGGAPREPRTAPQATTGAGAGAAAVTPVSGGPTVAAPPKGELRMAVDFLPANLDPTKTANLLRLGIGETLTRLTPDLKVEPWLAERVT